jgi:hypothetical protein
VSIAELSVIGINLNEQSEISFLFSSRSYLSSYSILLVMEV